MEKNVRTLKYMYGFGFAYLKYNKETGLYRGVCSNGNSTRSTDSMSQCIRDLERLGYR